MIESLAEHELSLAQAAKTCRVGPEAVRRWVRQGIRLPGLPPIRLKAIRVGREFRIRSRDLEDFLSRLNQE